MTASNVGVQGTGPEIVLWQEVVVVGVVVHFLHVLGLELLVDMGIAWVVNVIDTLMIGMMEDVMEIGIVLITVTTNMAAATAMLVTGIQPVEIDLQVIDMALAQTTHKMVMARKEGMTGTVVHEEVLIGMEVEWEVVMKEGVIGVDLVHMIAQAGVLVRHLIATEF